MISIVNPVVRLSSFSGNNTPKNKDEGSAHKKPKQKAADNKVVSSDVLFPDVLGAILEEQSRMDPAVLAEMQRPFFKDAVAQYEKTAENRTEQDSHIKNFLT